MVYKVWPRFKVFFEWRHVLKLFVTSLCTSTDSSTFKAWLLSLQLEILNQKYNLVLLPVFCHAISRTCCFNRDTHNWNISRFLLWAPSLNKTLLGYGSYLYVKKKREQETLAFVRDQIDIDSVFRATLTATTQSWSPSVSTTFSHWSPNLVLK